MTSGPLQFGGPRRLTSSGGPRRRGRSAQARRALTSSAASALAVALGLVWSVPTFGLLVTSFRGSVGDIRTTGWWHAL
ncbi:MAG: hypothetical protein LBE08_13310, partial [Bifidobacteriaceae bacterium]|nr:hypothetical protein [Bifidobacteriaceae bacterium]